MKTKWIVPKANCLVTVIMAAVLGLASFGCEKEQILTGNTLTDLSGIIKEDFWVDREGKIVYALEGSVTLEFPAEAVTEPTLFSVSLFPLSDLEMSGYNMMNCGVYLESADHELKFEKSVLLKLNYCISDFKAIPLNEENITIYSIIPNVLAYSVGECSVDCTWEMIKGCINECGLYVVGEN